MLPYILSISGLTALFTFIFALLGVQLFSHKMGSPPPRPNFDTTHQALVTVFTLITGEDWNEAMAVAMVAGPAAAVPYFCLVYAIGNYLLVSLCVAVVTAGWGATKQLLAKSEPPPLVSRCGTCLPCCCCRIVHLALVRGHIPHTGCMVH